MITRKELVFQIVLHILVFLFYSFDRNNPHIDFHEVIFFLSYAMAAAVIAYYLMPNFLYKKKQWRFFGSVLLGVFGGIFLEELVLEQIFFAGTRRARGFPGIFYAFFYIVPVL
ncbi:MAG: histidine kinase, partial [Allomuricauda sp.]